MSKQDILMSIMFILIVFNWRDIFEGWDKLLPDDEESEGIN